MNASEVWFEMDRIRAQFDRDMKIVREKCNHTYSNNSSAVFLVRADEHRCNVCYKRIENS